MPPVDTLFDLLKDYQPKKKRNERGELLQFFSDHVQRPVRFVAVRLSHYTMDELYALKSAFSDRLQRDGELTAIKYWWYITKTEKSGVV